MPSATLRSLFAYFNTSISHGMLRTEKRPEKGEKMDLIPHSELKRWVAVGSSSRGRGRVCGAFTKEYETQLSWLQAVIAHAEQTVTAMAQANGFDSDGNNAAPVLIYKDLTKKRKRAGTHTHKQTTHSTDAIGKKQKRQAAASKQHATHTRISTSAIRRSIRAAKRNAIETSVYANTPEDEPSTSYNAPHSPAHSTCSTVFAASDEDANEHDWWEQPESPVSSSLDGSPMTVNGEDMYHLPGPALAHIAKEEQESDSVMSDMLSSDFGTSSGMLPASMAMQLDMPSCTGLLCSPALAPQQPPVNQHFNDSAFTLQPMQTASVQHQDNLLPLPVPCAAAFNSPLYPAMSPLLRREHSNSTSFNTFSPFTQFSPAVQTPWNSASSAVTAPPSCWSDCLDVPSTFDQYGSMSDLTNAYTSGLCTV